MYYTLNGLTNPTPITDLSIEYNPAYEKITTVLYQKNTEIAGGDPVFVEYKQDVYRRKATTQALTINFFNGTREQYTEASCLLTLNSRTTNSITTLASKK